MAWIWTSRYRMSLGGSGRLDLGSAFTYAGGLKRQINPGQASTELIGTYGFPRWRNSTSAVWVAGPWVSSLTANTIGAYDDFRTVAGVFPKVGRNTTFDMNVTYTGFKGVSLALGGNNIFDEQPPYSNVDWYAYDTSVHNPRGAFWYVRGKYAF